MTQKNGNKARIAGVHPNAVNLSVSRNSTNFIKMTNLQLTCTRTVEQCSIVIEDQDEEGRDEEIWNDNGYENDCPDYL